MSANDNLLTVLVMLIERGAVSAMDFEESLGVDRRTIRNYMSALKKAGFPILSSRGRSSLYQLQTDHPLSGIRFSQEEIEALNAAKEFLKTEKGFLYEETYESILKRIKSRAKVLQDPPAVPTAQNTSADPDRIQSQEWLRIIRGAIHENCKLQMVYHSAGRGVTTQRIVWPFGLYNADDENYLLAHCETSDDMREFNVKRIKSLIALSEYFPKSSRVSVKEYFKDSMGAFGGKPFRIKLQIRPPFAQSVQEKQLVNNQKTKALDDGSILFEAKVSGRPDVARWILGMGEYCTVLEPEDLKKEIQTAFKNAVERYRE